MSNAVIYSMCCRLGDDRGFARHLEMVRLWLAHLRGPGQFDGRVVLLSNEPTLDLPEVDLVPMDDSPPDRRSLFAQRVLMHERLKPAPGETWMQLDTDALAMRPVAPLFATADEQVLRAAPSGLSPLHEIMARPLMGRPLRAWYGRVHGWRDRRGVSACLTSCTAEQWRRLMGAWARAIRRHGDRPLPTLGDQSFLNLLYMTGRLAVRPLQRGLVHHLRTDDACAPAANAATVLHFVGENKLERMRERSVA